MRKKLFVGNWKMNKRVGELGDFFQTFEKSLKDGWDQNDIGFAVPCPFIQRVVSLLKGKPAIVAAQNFHWETSGAFTGETSLDMLADSGISWSIVGHSERRQYFNETDETVANKVAAATKKNFHSIVCVGETLDERKQNKTNAVIDRQTKVALSKIENLDYVTIAYEPVWAIGTGLSATSQQAQEVHQFIRKILLEKFGLAANKTRILYGGSMNEKNFAELIAQPDIDGGLIGGASLKPVEFATICS